MMRQIFRIAYRFSVKCIIPLLLLGLPAVLLAQAKPATAEWSIEPQGGRGGKIIRVTNLDASGAGSFAEAVATKGSRIVVFEVGGVIDLKGATVKIEEPFLTIAGQTAPSPGITLIDGDVSLRAHHVIIQHLRIRAGASHRTGKADIDAFATSGAHDVLIDHCSFSWAVDENCSMSGPRFEGNTLEDWRKNTTHRVTISHCIIAEGLSNSIHHKGEHSKGTLVHDNATEILITNNLYASNLDRNALFKGGVQAVFANNYIYNPGVKAMHYALVKTQWKGHEYATGKLSVVGNVLQYGPDTKDIPLLDVTLDGTCQIFMADNEAKDRAGNPVTQVQGEKAILTETKPTWYKNLPVIPAADLRESIAKNAGARPWDRDEVDTRIIQEMLTQNGKIINSETEVGGYPSPKLTRAKFEEKAWDLETMARHQ